MKNYDLLTLDQIQNGLELKLNIPIEELERLISLLKDEVKKDIADYTAMREICEMLIRSFPAVIHIYQDTFILRARANFNDEIFSTSPQISYNKTHSHLILPNRFNLGKEPVFYGAAPIDSDEANGALTTILESYKKLIDDKNDEPKQILTLGKWIVKKPIHLFLLTFYPTAWKKSIHVQNINQSYVQIIEKVLTDLDKLKIISFYQYFSDCACKMNDSENNYLLTTAFFHALQEVYGQEIGILYSSSMTENYGLNIVLTKEILDANHLELNEVVMYKGVRNPRNRQNFKLFPFKAGFNKDDKYEFTDIVEPDVEKQYFSFENAENIIDKYQAEITGRKIHFNNITTAIVGLKKILHNEGYQVIVVLDSGLEERIETVLGLLYVQDDTYFDKFLVNKKQRLKIHEATYSASISSK